MWGWIWVGGIAQLLEAFVEKHMAISIKAMIDGG